MSEIPARKPRGAGNSRFEPADSMDIFPTPPWCARALVEHVLKPLRLYNGRHRVWEPACGALDMAKGLALYYNSVTASDIYPRGDAYGHSGHELDFLSIEADSFCNAHWIITNPPFGRKFMPFFERAMVLASEGIAMFVPLTAIETRGRHEKIYMPYGGRFCVAPFVERVNIRKNILQNEPGNARAYMWLVVSKNHYLPPLLHIPPCRKALERDSDYD